MVISVSDVRSNRADQIAHAVEVLGRASQRIAVFKAIYFGKKRVKTVREIAVATGLEPKRVLEEGRRLTDQEIVKQIRAAGMTAYEKDRFYSANKNKILQLVHDPVAFERFPTKVRPKIALEKTAHIRIPRQRIQVRYINVDDIDSFAKVKSLRDSQPGRYTVIPEAQFKVGIARILGESGHFQDWGGERRDLYTSKLRIFGRRYRGAFAFKGPGTKGILTPARMGKNGDQIQRLFKTPADAFLVQYWAQIGDAVVEQMQEFAKAKSVSEGSTVFFGVIDGDDSNRLLKAYPTKFRSRR